MKVKNIKLLATIELVLMTAIWGYAFLWVDDAIDSGFGTFPILFVRATLATLVLFLLTIKKNYLNKELWIGGAICGTVTFLAYMCQTIGQKYSSVSSSAFITSLYVVFIPIIEALIFKKKNKTSIYILCTTSLIGCFILNVKIPFDFHDESLLGNSIILICALLFAIQIMVISYYAKRVDCVQLTVIQLLTMAILALVSCLLFQDFSITTKGLKSVILAGVLSSGLCSLIQAHATKYIDNTISGLIMGLESVFATIFAVLILKQYLSVLEVIGCVMRFMSSMLSQMDIEKLFNKEKPVSLL